MTVTNDTLVALEVTSTKVKLRYYISATIRYLLLGGVGLMMLYPLIWLIGASFKTNSEIFANPSFWPSKPTLEGFINAGRHLRHTHSALFLEYLLDNPAKNHRYCNQLYCCCLWFCAI